MTHADDLPADFYDRDAVLVARDLLGCTLVGRGCSGIIVETEAYHEREQACHAWRGNTPRTAPMFGPGGTMYVYFTYGMHWCCNAVTGPVGDGAAVLIRALAPSSGIDEMRRRRSQGRSSRASGLRDRDLCNGPAKLVQALGIDAADNEHDLRGTSVPRILRDGAAPTEVLVGPRIGISVARKLPWRFGIPGPWLSRPFPHGE